MASFRASIPVRFDDCDPAGIVFYPRYFEMLNRFVEDWFAEGLDYSFPEMHLKDGRGVPTVRLEVEFRRPSRFGDRLDWSLSVLRLGRSSLEIAVEVTCARELRLSARQLLAFTSIGAEMRSVPLPQELRARMESFAVEGGS